MTPAVLTALRSFAVAATELADALEAAGIEPALHPEVAAALNRLGPAELLFRAVALFWSFDADVVRSRSMKQPIVAIRYAMAYVLRERFGWVYAHIGHTLNRDHTSIMHAVGKVDDWSPSAKVEYLDRLNNYLDKHLE